MLRIAPRIAPAAGYRRAALPVVRPASRASAVKCRAALAHLALRLPMGLQFGDSIAVCGSPPEIGAWNPDAAAPLVWAEGDIWGVNLDLSVDSFDDNIEYKYIIRGKNGSLSWQTIENQVVSLALAAGGILQINDSWDYGQIGFEIRAVADPAFATSSEGSDEPADVRWVLPDERAEHTVSEDMASSPMHQGVEFAAAQPPRPVFAQQAYVHEEQAPLSVAQDVPAIDGSSSQPSIVDQVAAAKELPDPWAGVRGVQHLSPPVDQPFVSAFGVDMPPVPPAVEEKPFVSAFSMEAAQVPPKVEEKPFVSASSMEAPQVPPAVEERPVVSALDMETPCMPPAVKEQPTMPSLAKEAPKVQKPPPVMPAFSKELPFVTPARSKQAQASPKPADLFAYKPPAPAAAAEAAPEMPRTVTQAAEPQERTSAVAFSSHGNAAAAAPPPEAAVPPQPAAAASAAFASKRAHGAKRHNWRQLGKELRDEKLRTPSWAQRLGAASATASAATAQPEAEGASQAPGLREAAYGRQASNIVDASFKKKPEFKRRDWRAVADALRD